MADSSDPKASVAPDDAADHDDRVRWFRDALRELHGDAVVAIVLYGSYGRGQRDTVLDFYVLFDRYARGLPGRVERIANYLLPPNVYHLSGDINETKCAAKYATVTLSQFERCVARDFHSYFWSRFAQPFTVVYCQSASEHDRLRRLRHAAAMRMIRATAALLTPPFSTRELWIRALGLTYGCELRSEQPDKPGQLYAAYSDDLERVTAAVAARTQLQPHPGDGLWNYPVTRGRRLRCAWTWRVRRAQGKVLSIARLFKAAFTFNDPLDYILWKVERHSGVHADPTPLQRRYPLLFSWGLLWRVYRQGGFR